MIKTYVQRKCFEAKDGTLYRSREGLKDGEVTKALKMLVRKYILSNQMHPASESNHLFCFVDDYSQQITEVCNEEYAELLE